jgi:hypothetical protein
LLYKTKASALPYVLFQTYTTNSLGSFSIITQLDIAQYDFQVVIENITAGSPNNLDINFFTNKILNQNFTPIDYYRMDVNVNSVLSISDIYLIYRRINENSWPSGVPNYRILTQQEWTIINSSSVNLVPTYPGTQSIILTNPAAGGSSVFYIIKTGQSN